MRVGPGSGSGGRRAQALQLGALLLFAIAIINLSLYQLFVVPDQNAEIEFKHNQRVHDQMENVRSTLLRTATTGSDLSASVQMAPQYPSRTLFVNPGPPAGSLRTESLGNLEVENAEAIRAETDDVWDGSVRSYDTKRLVYQPGYNLYSNAPNTVYGNSVVYNDFSPTGNNRRLNLTGQTVVNGKRISLVALAGTLSTSGTGVESLEFKPASASAGPIAVRERSSSEPVTVRVPTKLTEDDWRALLDDELDPDGTPGTPEGGGARDGTYLQGLSCTNAPPQPCGTLTLTFETGTTYDLRLAKVGVGGGVAVPAAAYVTRIRGSGSVGAGETTELVVEARDGFNNPVSGVEVRLANGASLDGSVSPTTATTDGDGRATFEYTAPGDPSKDDTVRFVIDPDSDAGDRVEFAMDTVSGGGGSGDGTPPAARNGDATPGTISPGEPVDLSATFDDTSGRGGSDIFEATWTDTVSGDSGALSATDGQFDQALEDVDTTVPGSETSDWSTGDHDITLSGTDANGNTGQTTVTVTVTSGPQPASLPAEIIYVDANGNDDGEIQSAPLPATTYPTASQVKGVGPLEADLDGTDAALEVPYVENTNKEIVAVDSGGNPVTLMDDVQAREQGMAVGDIDGDGRTEVLFVGNANGRLRQVDHADGGTSSEITVGGSPVSAKQVIGYEDFNGDGDRDVVFVDGSDVLSYIDGGTIRSTGYAPSTNAALGQPADLDDDSDLEVPAVNSNKRIEVVSASGTVEQTVTSVSASESPIATVQDLTGDGVPDVAYLGENNNKIRVIGVADGGTVTYNEKADTIGVE